MTVRTGAWRLVAVALALAVSTAAAAAEGDLKVVATIKPIHSLSDRADGGRGHADAAGRGRRLSAQPSP